MPFFPRKVANECFQQIISNGFDIECVIAALTSAPPQKNITLVSNTEKNTAQTTILVPHSCKDHLLSLLQACSLYTGKVQQTTEETIDPNIIADSIKLELEHLQLTNREQHDTIIALQTSIAAMTNDRVALEAQHEEKSKVMEKHCAQLAEFHHNLSTEMSAIRAENTQLRVLLEEQQAEAQRCMSQTTITTTSDNLHQQREIADLQEKMDDLHEKLNDLASINNKLTRAKCQYEAEIDDLRQEIEDLTSTNHKLLKAKLHHEAEIVNIQEQIDSLISTKCQCEEEIIELKNHLFDSKAQVSSDSLLIQELQARILMEQPTSRNEVPHVIQSVIVVETSTEHMIEDATEPIAIDAVSEDKIESMCDISSLDLFGPEAEVVAPVIIEPEVALQPIIFEPEVLRSVLIIEEVTTTATPINEDNTNEEQLPIHIEEEEEKEEANDYNDGIHLVDILPDHYQISVNDNFDLELLLKSNQAFLDETISISSFSDDEDENVKENSPIVTDVVEPDSQIPSIVPNEETEEQQEEPVVKYTYDEDDFEIISDAEPTDNAVVEETEQVVPSQWGFF